MAKIEKIVVEPTYVLRLSETELRDIYEALSEAAPFGTSLDTYQAIYEALHG